MDIQLNYERFLTIPIKLGKLNQRTFDITLCILAYHLSPSASFPGGLLVLRQRRNLSAIYLRNETCYRQTEKAC